MLGLRLRISRPATLPLGFSLITSSSLILLAGDKRLLLIWRTELLFGIGLIRLMCLGPDLLLICAYEKQT